MQILYDETDMYFKELTLKSIIACALDVTNPRDIYVLLLDSYRRRTVLDRVQFDGGFFSKAEFEEDCEEILHIHCKLSPNVCSTAIDRDFDLSETSWVFSVPLFDPTKIDDGTIKTEDVLASSSVEVNPYQAWHPSVMERYVDP